MAQAEAIAKLIRELREADFGIADEAMEKLIHIGEPAILPLIAALQKDKEPWVRYSIMFALGELGDKRALPSLKEIQANATNVTHAGRTLANVATQMINAITNNNPPY